MIIQVNALRVEDNLCSVCDLPLVDRLNPKSSTQLTCGDIFHTECLQQAHAANPNCPLCFRAVHLSKVLSTFDRLKIPAFLLTYIFVAAMVMKLIIDRRAPLVLAHSMEFLLFGLFYAVYFSAQGVEQIQHRNSVWIKHSGSPIATAKKKLL